MFSAIAFFQTEAVSGVVYDTDAQAFITAAGLTSDLQKGAINQLVLDFKAAGTWGLMLAIYPFIGGSAVTHKWNLKDPQDTDAAFRLTFGGGWTHSSTGAYANGTNAYANTYINPSTSTGGGGSIKMLTTSASVHQYHRTADPGIAGGPNHGGYQSGATRLCLVNWQGGTGDADMRLMTTNTFPAVLNALFLKRGNLITYKTNGTTIRYRSDDGTGEPSRTMTVAAGVPNMLFIIGARYTGATPPAIGTLNSWVNSDINFFAIGAGISSTQSTAQKSAVTTYQTTLSRLYV